MKLSPLFGLLVVTVLAACAGDPTCKDACDKSRSCGLSASGLSCNTQTTGCTSPDNNCARCIVDRSCSEIRSGACATACPGFSP